MNPLGYALALTAVSAMVLTTNGARTALQFHNPNVGKSIWIAPLPIAAAPNGAGSLQVLPGGDRNFTDAQNSTCGWNACTDTGQTANLTILEWNKCA